MPSGNQTSFLKTKRGTRNVGLKINSSVPPSQNLKDFIVTQANFPMKTQKKTTLDGKQVITTSQQNIAFGFGHLFLLASAPHP